MKSKLFFLSALITVFLACNKSDSPIDPVDPGNPISNNFEVDKIDGTVQKGPFLNGTSITIFELNSDFAQTGRSFASEIRDNSGTYTLQNLSLVSEFIEVRANGFYFNEVLNRNSQSPITLTAISDLTNKSSLNINLLSTMEKDRVQELLNQGNTFTEAKMQVQGEILRIFEIGTGGSTVSELRDITKNGDENGMLLAVSLILQGAFENVADLSKLVADVKADIFNDGTLDDPVLGAILLNNAERLDLSAIRTNLEEKYQELGLPNAVVPPFEKYINDFIANTPFVGSSGITYPEFGSDGTPNVLHPNNTEVRTGNQMNFSLSANLEEGTSLIVRMKFFGVSPALRSFGDLDWEINRLNGDTITEFKSKGIGEIDSELIFTQSTLSNRVPLSNKITVEFYENGSSNPSEIKEVIVTNVTTEIFYPNFGDFGQNIFSPDFKPNRETDSLTLSMRARLIEENMSVRVKVYGAGWDLDLSSVRGWDASAIDPTDRSRTFTTDGISIYDLKLDFYRIVKDPNSSISQVPVIELYENGATSPTWRTQINFI